MSSVLGRRGDTDHLFFHCPISWRVLTKVYSWMGVSSVLSSEAQCNFLQHLMLQKGSKQMRKTMVMIWVATINTIWGTRNHVPFEDGKVEVVRLVDAIMYKVWMWLKVK